MKKQFFFGLIIMFFAASIWGSIDLPTVHGSSSNQTIPTRTPTPIPPTATPSGGGNNGENNNNPTPTNTPADGSDPTPTSTLLPVNIAPTPAGGFLSTAVPCGSNPTIQTLDATNVRSGPGVAYDIIGGMVYLEVRYIVGRAETAEWWLIQFNNGELGWVADEVVDVQGYTAIVPIVEAPPLDGGTPTPGTIWNPTPPPVCTVTPPPTHTATAVPTEPAAVAESVNTPEAPPTEPPPTEARPTSTPILQATAVSLDPPAAPTIADSSPPEESSGNLGLILLGAAGLLGAGIFLFTRKKSE